MNPNTSESECKIRFTGSVLGPQRHICGFFRNPDEEYQVLLPFIKEGIERGDKAFHVVNPKSRNDHLKRLDSFGINVTQTQNIGRLELCDWENAYFRDGYFDQDKMLGRWQDVLEGASQRGFSRTRLVAHMECALEKRGGVTDPLEYEARFNFVHHRDRDSVICAYDLRKFAGDIITDVLRTHPMIIVGGILQEKSFFMPPEQFLRDLRNCPVFRDSLSSSSP